MSVTPETRSAAASAMARWSAKALLIAAGVTLVAGALWYARAATVPLVVAALVSTQVYPLVGWMTRHGLNHGLAVAASLIGVVVVMSALAWLFADSLFGNLGGLGEDISKGVDQVLDWADDNSTWVAQHDEEIRQFLSSLWPATKEAAGGVFTIALG